MKHLGRRQTVKDDSRAIIQSPLSLGDLTVGDRIKIDSFREIFANKAIDMFDGPPLPRTVRVAEIHGHFSGHSKCGMLGHLTTVVVGESLAKVDRQPLEGFGKGFGDAGSVLGASQGHNHDITGNPFSDDQDGSAIAGAHDKVRLPVARDFTAIDLGRPFSDVDGTRQATGELALGSRCRAALRPLSSQVRDQLLLESTFRVEVNEVVDGFVAHASARIIGVPATQGDFNLLGCCTGTKQGNYLFAQSRGVRDFVADGSIWAPAGPLLRFHSAVPLAPSIASNFAVYHGCVPVKRGSQFKPADTLRHCGEYYFTFLGGKSPLVFTHQHRSNRIRPQRQRRFFSKGRAESPPSPMLSQFNSLNSNCSDGEGLGSLVSTFSNSS